MLRYVFSFALLALPGMVQAKTTIITSGVVQLPASIASSDSGNIDGETLLRVIISPGLRFGGGDLVFYGNAFWARDSAGNSFAAKQKLALGTELRFPLGNGARLGFGAKYELDNRDISGLTYKTLIGTVDYTIYRRHDFAGGVRVLNGWANLRYPGAPDAANESNLLAQGRFEWGWEYASGGVKLVPFLALGFTDDSAGFSYNNKAHAEAGMRIKAKIAKNTDLSLSLRYIVERRFQTGDTHDGPRISLGWFGLF